MVQLQFGEDITSTEKLVSFDLQELVEAIRLPRFDLDKKTSQLRRVGGIDPKAYQNLKKELPYITCGIFNPPFRKTENFANINCFILDFDHLSEKQTDPETVKNILKKDERVAFMFTSPGGDGLKLLFVLKEAFTDHGKYSLFYKLFAADFSRTHNLQQVIDKKTSDVTRATFLCHDPDAWHNPFYDGVDAAAYINFDSAIEVGEAMEIGRQQEEEFKANIRENDKEETESSLPDDVLLEIKRRLNPKYRPKERRKAYFVPDEVNQLEVEIRDRCAEVGMEITESNPIQYGRQISFKAGDHIAELNIFFGRRGFSVVKSTKTICSAELNDLAYQLVMELIED